MKVAIVTVLYKRMIDDFYTHHADATSLSYEAHKELFDSDMSFWASGWARALRKRGYEVLTITINASELLNQWARENTVASRESRTIALEQIVRFKPDILWYDYFDVALLRQIKDSVPSLRATIGWSGSAIVNFDVFREVRFVLSCAPEVVQRLNDHGLAAYHLHHAFDPAVLDSIEMRTKSIGLSFVGQIVRGGQYHGKREQLLRQLSRECDLSIFSTSSQYDTKDILLIPVLQLAYMVVQPVHWLRIEHFFSRFERFRKLLDLRELPGFPYDRALKPSLKPPVFGTRMFQCLADSQVVLNVHADSSPRFASNMRLFETTGIGSCLLTDRKENISQLFEENTEIVTYESIDDCIEKARWLAQHSSEAGRIAQQGQIRTLRDHTFDVRSEKLINYFERALQ